MSDNKYNGWTNWYTWNYKLWLDNDESSHNAVLEMAVGKDAYELSLELQMYAEDTLDAIANESGFFADVCNSAINEVNFYEIAQAYINDLDNN